MDRQTRETLESQTSDHIAKVSEDQERLTAVREDQKRLAAARWLAAYATFKDASDYAVAVGREVRYDADHGHVTDVRVTATAARVDEAQRDLLDARRVYEESLR